jgi:hypothetical protein
LWAFGFECDPGFPHLAGTGVHRGVELAEDNLRRNATEFGLSPVAYRVSKNVAETLSEKVG